MKFTLESKEKPHKSISIQQQRFYLHSLCLSGTYCNSVQLLQLLIDFGSHLCKLRVDFDCLLKLINDVNNNTQLKNAIMQRNLIYFEFDLIDHTEIDSGDFHRVINFLFDNENSLRHVTLLPAWFLKIFESIKDMKRLKNIISSFKHCTQFISIIIYRCIFSNQSYNDKESMSTENAFCKWLNDNTHLTFEQDFYLECDNDNKMLKLWLENITNSPY